MSFKRILTGLLALAGLVAAVAAPSWAAARDIGGVTCSTPPVDHCTAIGACPAGFMADQGNAVEPKSGRKFFLDYPCDLKPGEKVIFILSIHGAGSIGNWQRHYFPASDYKEKYRLVIATPTAATATPLRMWIGDADDTYLQGIATYVFDLFGKQNIKSFWLAGHSQGGMTSNRIVCTDFFKDKVDGWLSLSGGRIGPAALDPSFFRGRSLPALPTGTGQAAGARPGVAATPTCDINYIFETGQHEIVSLPDTSPWADKYMCGPRKREADVVDTVPGWVDAGPPAPGAEPNPAWGIKARPGTAQVYVYPGCKEHRLVADVERLDKGHTEGLEPHVTEQLIKMIVAAPGGKLQHAS